MSEEATKIRDLEARIKALEEWKESITRVVFNNLESTDERLEKIETSSVELRGTLEPDEDGHVIISSEYDRSAARKAALKVAGKYPAGQLPLVLCEERNCTAPEHLKLASRGEAKKYNTDRVNRELEAQNKTTLQFALETLSTAVGDGHRVSTEGDYHTLPSGRSVSVIRATKWAFGDSGEVPGQVKRECDRGDCVAPEHLS